MADISLPVQPTNQLKVQHAANSNLQASCWKRFQQHTHFTTLPDLFPDRDQRPDFYFATRQPESAGSLPARCDHAGRGAKPGTGTAR